MQRVYKKSNLRHRLIVYVVLLSSFLSCFLQSCSNAPVGDLKRKRIVMETGNEENVQGPKKLRLEQIEQTRLEQIQQINKQAITIITSLADVNASCPYKQLDPNLEKTSDYKRLDVQPDITKSITTKSAISSIGLDVDTERSQTLNKQLLDLFKMPELSFPKRRRKMVDSASLFPSKSVKEVAGKDGRDLKPNRFEEARKFKQQLNEAKFIPFVINPNFEYDENMILMVWDSFLKSQGEIQYFVSNGDYLQAFFNKDGNGMVPRKLAALLVRGTMHELYLNSNNKSVSICGVVNYETGISENLVLMSLEEAIDQIKIWNSHQVLKNQKITNHLIVFPYHVASKHWALGVLELNLDEIDEQAVLRNAQIEVFNPLPRHGGNQVSDVVYFCIQGLFQRAFSASKIELIAKNSKHKKQQNDKASCGVIVAENGKFFLSSSSVRNTQLMQAYPWGAKQLRRKHFKEVCRNDFYQAQFVKPSEIPQIDMASVPDQSFKIDMASVADQSFMEFYAELDKQNLKPIEFCKTLVAQQGFENIRKAAAQGYAGAQYALGLMFVNKLVVEKDDYQAVEWFQRAAVQGYAKAQFALAVMSVNGRGCEKDEGRAIVWYRSAAHQGHPAAQNDLGIIYANGIGVDQDQPKAVTWFRKAAMQGYARAQFALGVMYGKGRGIYKDEDKSRKWYQKAADQGYVKAQLALN